ncbi:MAG: AbrB/MazE/SpoVT family DNA-binding domain-containing protein [Acholeplasmataceae bacterium]|jgi:bifunctional DNA-binding transcriptional regulator/antitoxin component of YhaV-PrlF toxin-antitoxin module
MVLVAKRSVIQSGRSHQISVPSEWIKGHGIVPGDEVIVIANDVVAILPSVPMDKNRITRAMEDIASIAVIAQHGVYSKKPDVLDGGSNGN